MQAATRDIFPSMSVEPSALSHFFNPQRIAVIGASEQGMYPAGILQSLMQCGYSGAIYPINPRRATVFGLPTYPDVTQTPEPPDLAVFTLPREGVLGAIKQCAQVGVKAACLISAGFGESGDAGMQMQKEMVELAHHSGMAIIGPNCAGLANIPGKVIATRLPVQPRAGDISFTSQSGALMMALYGLFADRGAGMNLLVSLGNQADVTLSDTLIYLAQDPATNVAAAFLEGFADGQRFVEGVRALLTSGKPLILLKSGRTLQGQQAAATHTGALAGSDRVFSAVCRQFGVILVDDVHALVNTTCLYSTYRSHFSPHMRLAVVTQSGGLGSFTADLCAQNVLSTPPLNAVLQAQLQAMPHLLSFGNLENPADVRGAGVTGRKIGLTLPPFLEAPDNDLVLVLLARQMDRPEDLETAQTLIEVRQRYQKPLVVVWVGGRRVIQSGSTRADDILQQAGIPVFEQPSDAVQAIGRIGSYLRRRQSWLNDPERTDA